MLRLTSLAAVLLPCLQSLLGQVDLAFLSAYAVGMFFAGHLGDRMDLRIFLSVGMLGSGIFCCLFGWVSEARWLGVTGWPSVFSWSAAALQHTALCPTQSAGCFVLCQEDSTRNVAVHSLCACFMAALSML